MNPKEEFLQRLKNTEQALRERMNKSTACNHRFALCIIQTMRKDYCKLFQIGEQVEVPHEETRWESLE